MKLLNCSLVYRLLVYVFGIIILPNFMYNYASSIIINESM